MLSAPDAYAAGGLGGRSGAGRRPALLIVDLNYGFTDPASPLCCPADEAVAGVTRLLTTARGAGAPVIFTTIEYDAGGRAAAAAFLAKAPALAGFAPDSRWTQIDARIGPAADEPVLSKLFASAFFGTPLSALLTARGCDTVVVCGASTSGCVRATVVDALQHGYRVLVPREAVCDRAPGPHTASLVDIDAKYGDVVGLDDAEAALRAARFDG